MRHNNHRYCEMWDNEGLFYWLWRITDGYMPYLHHHWDGFCIRWYTPPQGETGIRLFCKKSVLSQETLRIFRRKPLLYSLEFLAQSKKYQDFFIWLTKQKKTLFWQYLLMNLTGYVPF